MKVEGLEGERRARLGKVKNSRAMKRQATLTILRKVL
jgi:hypothetical protein